MLTVRWSSKFQKDLKAVQKRGKDMHKFKSVAECLALEKPLPIRNRDHRLTGNWQGCRECHVEPDWLLIYRVIDEERALEFVRMGSHADLFG